MIPTQSNPQYSKTHLHELTYGLHDLAPDGSSLDSLFEGQSSSSHEIKAKEDSEVYDVVIIGAGAAGLMCASAAGQLGASVLLVDHAEKIGEKIRISGGGRCNFTNRTVSAENFVSENPNFCRSALSKYRPSDFIELVERHSIAYHEKHKGQLFCDGSSQQIIDMLLQECAQGQVRIVKPCRVISVARRDGLTSIGNVESAAPGKAGEHGFEFVVRLSFGHTAQLSVVRAKYLVLATGGLSIPKIGASDFGYRIARQFGHSVVTTEPSLVPLTFDAKTLPSLPGLALPVEVSCKSALAKKGIQIFSEDLLFTHKGLSGPAILQISNYWQHASSVGLNFVPDVNLFEHLKAAKANSRQSLAQVLHALLPKRLVEVFVPAPNATARIAELPDQVLRELAQDLQNLVVTPTGSEGYQKAEVTRGGVNTLEMHQATMESRLVGGLFMIGEVVDVTGWLGGYNFQWAWSSAVACAREIGRRVDKPLGL